MSKFTASKKRDEDDKIIPEALKSSNFKNLNKILLVELGLPQTKHNNSLSRPPIKKKSGSAEVKKKSA